MYGALVAVRAVDVDLHAGEVVALMGRNGSGKSSLLWALQGSGPRTGGEVDVGGVDPGSLRSGEARRLVGLVPQSPSDLLYLPTVEAECTQADADAGAAPGTCRTLLERLAGEINDDAHPPRPLGGTATRARARRSAHTEAARAAARRATRGLDPTAKERFATIVAELAAAGHAVVIATHDVELVASVADRVVVLADGEVVADGPTAEVVCASPAFAPQVAKILSPAPWLTVREVIEALGMRPSVLRIGACPAVAIVLVSIAGLMMFAWPLLISAPSGLAHSRDAPFVFAALLPCLIAVLLSEMTSGRMDTKAIAMLGVLAAVGAALRPMGAGTAGLETVFFLLVLGGRVYGPGFGFVLGSTTLFASALLTGGIGPWLPFQMLAASWVGLGAGLLPPARGRREIAMLAAYGAASAFAFGMLLNLWFWPFTVGTDSQLSYIAGAPVLENLHRFLLFTLGDLHVGMGHGASDHQCRRRSCCWARRCCSRSVGPRGAQPSAPRSPSKLPSRERPRPSRLSCASCRSSLCHRDPVRRGCGRLGGRSHVRV